MLRALLLKLLATLRRSLFFFLEPPDIERIKNVERARRKVVQCHDEVLIDSSTGHLLLATQKGLHLVSRKQIWKTKLSEAEVQLYEKKVRRAFGLIERRRS